MDLEELSDVVKECQISDNTEDSEDEVDNETIIDDDYKKENLQNWPRLKLSKIPAIFLHKPENLEHHVQNILSTKIKFYQPTCSKNFTKITCASNNDHKSLIKYFDKKQLPYHTYGNPSKRKIKVVIKGLLQDTPLNKVKDELKSQGIPIIRVHKMKTKNEEDPNMLVLGVVPYDEKGLTLLGLKKLLGRDVTVVPPKPKISQCYRCQKWGHTERYCHGEVKCVKCAGDHLYKKCPRSKETTDPPKCANCGSGHTANYKKCPQAPFTVRYELSNIIKQMKAASMPSQKAVVVTVDNCHALYKINE